MAKIVLPIEIEVHMLRWVDPVAWPLNLLPCSVCNNPIGDTPFATAMKTGDGGLVERSWRLCNVCGMHVDAALDVERSSLVAWEA